MEIVPIAHIPDRIQAQSDTIPISHIELQSDINLIGHSPIRYMLSLCAFNAKRDLLLFHMSLQLSTRSESQPILPGAFSAK